MKKLMIVAALAATLMTLSSCGRKSEASREQINNAHAQAREMLQNAHPDSIK